MPRAMPPLAVEFGRRVADALALARAGDLAAAAPLTSLIRQEWRVSRAELLYELAYLRIFIEWELFLEQTLFRYLCGYASGAGRIYAAVGGTFCATLHDAEISVLAGQAFVL